MQLVGYSSSTSSRTKNVDRTLIGCQAILSTNVNDDSQAEQADEDLLSKQLEKVVGSGGLRDQTLRVC